MDAGRYLRQTILPQMGEGAQRRLGAAHAAVVGAGALGCVAADLLARAGVGRLTLIDRDVVELTNLQRQSLFTEDDARDATPKAIAAAERLRRVNSEIAIDSHVADLTPRNAEDLLTGADVILDGTDNFETRLLLNDVSVKHARTLCYAGVVGTRAMWASFVPGGPCLRCLLPDLPAPGSVETCDTAGVLGPAAAACAAAQAADAIRVLVDGGGPHRGLSEWDIWTGGRREITLRRDPGCPCCGLSRFDYLNGRVSDTVVLCGSDAVQVCPAAQTGADLSRVARLFGEVGAVHASPYLVRGRVSGHEVTVFADGRAIVKGTRDAGRARAVYARLLG